MVYQPSVEEIAKALKIVKRAKKLKRVVIALRGRGRGRMASELEKERFFIERAIKRLVSVTTLRFEIPNSLDDCEVVKTELEGMAAKLPNFIAP